jgi:hypothetical protein
MAVIETMKYQESTSYRALPYFDSAVVTEQDRSALCQWGLSFVDACNVDRKICSIAISYFDRFLSSRSSNIVPLCLADQGDFQLAFIVSISNIQPLLFYFSACFHLLDLLMALCRPPSALQTCLLIALKGREGVHVSTTFVSEKMCNGMYDSDEFNPMELEILKALSWRLNGPIPQDFIQYFAQLLPVSTDESVVEMLVDEATKNSEVALSNYAMALRAPSFIAFVAITTAIRSLDLDSLPHLDILGWWNLIGSVVHGNSVDSV